MYSIERTKDHIIVRGGTSDRAIFMAPPDSLIVYNSKAQATPMVSKVKDLSDEQLLLALVSIIEIKDFNK